MIPAGGQFSGAGAELPKTEVDPARLAAARVRECCASRGLDATIRVVRYAVYNPKDPRKGELLPDPELKQIILGQGETITKALAAASAPSGSVVWDRKEKRVAYTVP